MMANTHAGLTQTIVVEQLMELQALPTAMEEAAKTIRRVARQHCQRLELENEKPAVTSSRLRAG